MAKSKNNISLEPATEKDFEKIIEIENKLASRTYITLGGKKELAEIIKKGPIYLVKKDGQTIGLTAYYKSDDGSVYIDALAIDPAYQGKGFGREAMQKTLEKIKDTKKNWLVTHPENKAVNLYLSMGFKITGRKENYFGDGEPRIIMELQN